jgi:hypothetical protein
LADLVALKRPMGFTVIDRRRISYLAPGFLDALPLATT